MTCETIPNMQKRVNTSIDFSHRDAYLVTSVHLYRGTIHRDTMHAASNAI